MGRSFRPSLFWEGRGGGIRQRNVVYFFHLFDPLGKLALLETNVNIQV